MNNKETHSSNALFYSHSKTDFETAIQWPTNVQRRPNRIKVQLPQFNFKVALAVD